MLHLLEKNEAAGRTDFRFHNRKSGVARQICVDALGGLRERCSGRVGDPLEAVVGGPKRVYRSFIWPSPQAVDRSATWGTNRSVCVVRAELATFRRAHFSSSLPKDDTSGLETSLNLGRPNTESTTCGLSKCASRLRKAFFTQPARAPGTLAASSYDPMGV
jgi:hypothetical protein